MNAPLSSETASAQAEQNRRQLYFYDRLRALPGGILETASSTFLLFILVRHFEAGPLAKSIVSGAAQGGLLLCPLVAVLLYQGRPANKLAATIASAGALFFLAASFFPALPVFVICCAAALAGTSAIAPLMTEIYRQNYPDSERGKWFGRMTMVRVAVASAFGPAAGLLLERDLSWYRPLLLLYALALGVTALCYAAMPARPVEPREPAPPRMPSTPRVQKKHGPLSALRDKRFRWVLSSYMLLGLGNLMMLPLRVEYLASTRDGLALSSGTVALLTTVVPGVAFFIASPIWSRLFDQLLFLHYRLLLNAALILATATFFFTGSLPGVALGMFTYGFAMAGANISWTLWVIDYAPPGRTGDYMALHAFLTGLRGIAAPLAGFYGASYWGNTGIAILAVGLLLGSCGMLWIELIREKAPAITTSADERTLQINREKKAAAPLPYRVDPPSNISE